MSDESPYSKREVDIIHESLGEKMDLMLSKQDYTNGKVRSLYFYLTAVAAFAMGLGIVEAKTVLSLIL